MSRTLPGPGRRGSIQFLVPVILICLLTILPEAAVSGAIEERSIPSASDREWSFSARGDNDILGGADRYYTSGIAFSLAHTGPSWMDPIADRLPWGEGRRTVSYELSQLIMTPDDISSMNPNPSDRPYAGLLTFGIALNVDQPERSHTLRVITGVVGPWALAEEAQREVHHLTGNGGRHGWDFQVKNEPILNLAYEYRRKIPLAGESGSWALEALPQASGWLGNALTQGQAGMVLRTGCNIPDDFGPVLMKAVNQTPPRRGGGWGFSLYAVGAVNLVLRDITLDGNTFRDSRSVEKDLLVPLGGFGMSLGNSHFLLTFTYYLWGNEFRNQLRHTEFGALSFTWMF